MSKSSKDAVLLHHILDAITQIEKYLGESEFIRLQNDDMLTDALARRLEIIGEASNTLSHEFKNKHSEIPFRKIIDMRNFLIHEYTKVERKIIWDTCKDDLPELKKQIQHILDHQK